MASHEPYDAVNLGHPSAFTFPTAPPSSQSHERVTSDDMSLHSNSPLQPNTNPFHNYPPSMPEANDYPSSMPEAKHVQIQDYGRKHMEGYDPERGQSSTTLPSSGHATPGRGHVPRNSSWDLLAGINKFTNEYETYETRNASEAHLAFAEGDIPDNRFARFYHYLLNVSVVTRWVLFIVPIMAILWIPGILSLTATPKANIWGVRLIWWSAWFSVLWGGWWACLALARLLPFLLRGTIGVVSVGSRRYIDWFSVLNRYVALFAWTIANFVTYQPLINNQQNNGVSQGSVKAVNLISKGLLGLLICAGILVAEKFAIQWIAGKFHEKSYAERISAQKFAVRTLTTLYRYSRDIPGRNDTMRSGPDSKRASVNPRHFLKKALKGVRFAATTTTTALGNVASEIAGTSVLQPNSPQAMVQTALQSANKTRLLARRLFYSFVQERSDILVLNDIAHHFKSREEAEASFGLFDKDSNGDATRDEVEMACLEVHREQLAIEHSMRDLDSAVGRLDNILMSLYFVVCFIVVAVVLDTELVSLITGAGTLILGLSWLIGSSLAEVLTSIIFLFIKHPYDVGDRVDLPDGSYTVKEIHLLSTIFLDSNGALVHAPNTKINDQFIVNIRRSPQMSETFAFDVAFDTSFEDLERLRECMLEFLKKERRDFLPSFDVFVVDIPEQEKMSLKADIKYKSNWQQGAVKAKRRNKWICALKKNLAELGIYGPSGDPSPKPSGPSKYTLVPWEEVQRNEREHANGPKRPSMTRMPTEGWDLTDKNALSSDAEDVFGETEERYMATPRRGMTESSGISMPSRSATMPMPSGITMPAAPGESIEMRTPRAARDPNWPAA